MRLGYAVFALVVLGSYSLAAWRGYEIGGGKRGLIPANVRQAPGGYRSFTYWRGGK
jgi:hypothetical protein